MSLSQRLAEYVRACFTGLWIVSNEHEDALAEIARLCQEQHWALATWDIDRGLRVAGQAAAGANDPLAAIKSLSALAQPDGSALLVLPNFHRFLQSTEVLQALAHQIASGKQNRTFVVILSPLVQIPAELQTQFVVLEHDLPSRDQLRQIAAGIAIEPGEMPGEIEPLLDAAGGLTRFEAEGAFSLSLVRHGKLQPSGIWEIKENLLKKSGLMSLHRGGETFADLGGLDALKGFCLRALRAGPPGGSGDRKARARGILLLGVPGTGKSAICKALGNEIGRPTLILDVGALMAGLVGATEQNTRTALRIADAMSPCILMLDEVEKALSGVASSGQTDSGVSARLFGTFLGWLSDHTSDVFVVATSNDVTRLPPEFARAERFDGVFFLDLPGSAEKQRIWGIHRSRYDIDAQDPRPEDRDWTGAEIASCCRLSALLDLPLKEAARNVVPVALTAAESVERLRTWAAGRCLDASAGGLYVRGATAPSASTPARRVSRASSN